MTAAVFPIDVVVNPQKAQSGAKQVEDALNRVNNSADRMRDSLDRGMNRINVLASSIKTSLAGVAAGLVSIGAAKGLANAHLELQKINSTLEVATGSAQAAAKEYEFLKKQARELGLELNTSALQYAKFAVAAKETALEGKATRDIFLAMSKAASVLGLSAAETSGALNALQQMVSKGTVSSEELRGQLGERLPGAFNLAAKAMGVTTQELGKMLEQGKVTANDMLPKLAQELENLYGPKVQAAAGSLAGQMNRMNTAIFDLKVAIGNSGFIDFLTKGIVLATQLTDKVSSMFGGKSTIDLQTEKVQVLRKEVERLSAIGGDTKNLDEANAKLATAQKWLDRLTQSNKQLAKEEESVATARKFLADEQKILTEEQQKFIDKIKQEASEAGKSKAEIIKMQAAKLGVLDVTGNLIDKIHAEKNANVAGEKAIKDKLEAEKKSLEVYNQLILRIQEKVKTNKLELELGRALNESEKTQIEIDEKLLTGELKLTEAKKKRLQVELQELTISEKNLANQKFINEASANLAQSSFNRVKSLQEELKAQQEQNDMIGLTTEQVKDYVVNKKLEEAQTIRNAAQYAGPLHAAYLKHADDLEQVAKLQGNLIDEQKIARNARDFDHMFSEIERTGKTAFTQFAAHGTGAMESIGKSIKASIIDLLYQLTVRKWIVNIGTSISSSLFGSSGALVNSGGSAGSGGMGALDIANMASTGFNALSNGVKTGFGVPSMIGKGMTSVGGSSLFGSFGAGMTGGSEAAAFLAAESATAGAGMAATAGSFMSAAAGPLAIMYATTAILKSIAGDKRMGGGFGKAMNFMGDLPILGDLNGMVPILNTLFGRGPLKQKETNLIGDFTSEGFSGITSTKFKAQGGLVVSDKVDRVMTDTDTGSLVNEYRGLVEGGVSSVLDPFVEKSKAYATELGKQLDAGVRGTVDSLHNVAKILDLGTDAIDNFSFSINIASEKGQALTDAQIAQAINDASDAMIRNLIPSIDSFQKEGESLLQTVNRLGTEFNALETAATVLSGSAVEAKNAIKALSIEQRTALVDKAGGSDVLNSLIAGFYDKFLTPDEQFSLQFNSLDKDLNTLGFSANMTREDFKGLIMSVTQVGGISVDTAISLLKLQDRFVGLKDLGDQIANGKPIIDPEIEKQKNLDAVAEAYNKLEQSVANERTRLTDEYNKSLDDYNKRINDVNDSISKLTTLSDSLKQATDELRPLGLKQARNQITEAIANAAKGIFPEAAELTQALQTLTTQQESSFTNRRDFLKSQADSANLLDELGGAVDNQLTVEQAQLKKLEDAVKALKDGFESEMARLDQILENARTQIDLLNGIDGSILSVRDAIIELNRLLQRAGSATGVNPATGGVMSFPSNAEIKAFVDSNDPITSFKKAQELGISSLRISQATGISVSDINNFGTANNLGVLSRGFNQDDINKHVTARAGDNLKIYAEALQFAATVDEISKATGFTKEQIDKFGRDNGLPPLKAYATGASFVPETGPAIVHKGERIINTQQNADIVTTLKEMVAQISKNSVVMEELHRLFRNSMIETDDGLALQTKAAT